MWSLRELKISVLLASLQMVKHTGDRGLGIYTHVRRQFCTPGNEGGLNVGVHERAKVCSTCMLPCRRACVI